MRNEDGIWCDYENATCKKIATYVHKCQVEQSEFAFCQNHEKWWKARTHGNHEYQIRCPRCLPVYLERIRQPSSSVQSILPDPISGPIADAIDDAMYRQGVLGPDRTMVLRRLAASESSYVRAIFRSTAGTRPGYEDEKAI